MSIYKGKKVSEGRYIQLYEIVFAMINVVIKQHYAMSSIFTNTQSIKSKMSVVIWTMELLMLVVYMCVEIYIYKLQGLSAKAKQH